MAETVEFEINAKVDDALANIKSLENSTTKSVNAMSSAFGSLKTMAGAAFGFFAGRAIVDFFQESIAAASEADVEVAKLEASLRSVGDYTPQAVAAFEEFAGSLEKSSMFSDEAVLSQVSLAKQMGLSNEETKKLVQASADLASMTDGDLDGAFNALSKTLKGSAGALSNNIPLVKNFTEEQLKAGAAIDYVAKQYSGGALSALDTYAGAMKQLTNSTGNVQEALGKVVTQNPVVVEAMQAVSVMFQNLEALVVDNKEVIEEYIGSMIKMASKVLPHVVEGINFVMKAFAGLALVGAQVIRMVAGLLEGLLGFEVIQTMIGGFAQAVAQWYATIIEGSANVIKVLASLPGAVKFFKGIGVDIIDVANNVDTTIASLKNFKIEATDFDAAKKAIGKVKDSAKEFGDGVLTATIGASKGMDAFKKVVQEASYNIVNADGKMTQGAKDVAAAQNAAAQAVTKATVQAGKEKLIAAENDKNFLAEQKKNQTEAFKLIDDLVVKTADAEGKIQLEKKKSLDEIKRLNDLGALSDQQTADLKLGVEKKASDDILALQEKAAKEGQVFKDAVFAKDSDSILKITQEKENQFAQLKVLLDRGVLDHEDAEKLKAAITQDFAKKEKDINIQNVTDKYKDEMAIASSFLSGGLEGAVKSIVSIVGDRYIPGLGQLLSQVIGVFGAEAEEFKGQIAGMVDDSFLKNIIANIGSLVKMTPALIDQVTNVESWAPIVEDMMAALTEASPKLLASALKIFPKGFEMIIEGTLNGILKGAAQAGIDMSAAGKKAAADIRREFGKLNINFDEMGRKFSEVFDSFGKNIEQIFGGIGEAFGTVFENIGARLNAAFNGTFDGIGAKLRLVFTNFETNIRTTFEGIGNFLNTNVWQPLGELFTKFGSALTTEFTNFGTAISEMGTKFAEGATALFDKIKEGFASFGDFFQPAIDGIKATLQELFDGAAAAFSNAFSGIETFFAGIFDGIGDGFTTLFKNIFDPIYQQLEDAFTNPLKGFRKLLEDIKNAMKSPAESVKEAFSSPNKSANTVLDPGGLTRRGLKAIGLAKGGKVPPGFPNDSFPSMLTSDELVVPTDLVHRLEKLISRDENGSDGAMVAMLAKIANLLSQPMQVSTTAQVDGRALADIMLQLSRNNARLTA